MVGSFVQVGSLIFPLCMLWAMWADLRRFEIPNKISVVLALAWIVLAVVGDFGVWPAVSRIGFALAVLAAGIVLTALRVIGGGDAKLIATAALWTGWYSFVVFLFYMALAGGLLAVCLIVFRRWRLPERVAEGTWLRNLHERHGDIPYAVAIATASFLIFPRVFPPPL